MVARRAETNPYEMQAKLSLILAAIGGVCALALAVCVFYHFNLEEFTAYYKTGTLRFMVILGSTALGIVASAIGFFVALNSAGRKRNRLSSLAWTAFFVNAVAGTVTVCVFVIFWFAKEQVD
jgi:uncharacterized membrane protein